VVDAGIRVAKALANKHGAFELEFTHFPWSSETYKQTCVAWRRLFKFLDSEPLKRMGRKWYLLARWSPRYAKAFRRHPLWRCGSTRRARPYLGLHCISYTESAE
jgi:hypothetical protein